MAHITRNELRRFCEQTGYRPTEKQLDIAMRFAAHGEDVGHRIAAGVPAMTEAGRRFGESLRPPTF